jgi:uncharacterized protein
LQNFYIDKEFEYKYLNLLKNKILDKFQNCNCSIFLFGSRAGNKFRRDSDYDIGIQNIDEKKFLISKWELELDIEESIIPHRIDLINFDEADENFKKIALKEVIIWKK